MRSRTARGSESSPLGARSSRGPRGKHWLAIVAGIVAAVIVSAVSAGLAGAFSGTSTAAAASTTRGGPRGALRAAARAGRHLATGTGRTARPAAGAQSAGAPVAVSAASHPGRTSCTSLAHIGDSTSVGMVSRQWLANPAQRLRAQYADVGVRHALIDASGGRSIVEEMPGQLNGYRVATAWSSSGFRGCWVFALGTNDTANVAAGSNVGLTARIQEMMSVAHNEPVMWVNTQTGLSTGPWSEANMQSWNNALAAACKAYPNMRIFNWAAMVRPGWHLSDGIHYTSQGYAIRAHAIASALVRAFPAGAHSRRCIVK